MLDIGASLPPRVAVSGDGLNYIASRQSFELCGILTLQDGLNSEAST